MEERRKNQRISPNQALYHHLDTDDLEKVMHECWINDVSEGGISFDIRKNSLKAGDRIVVLYKVGNDIRKDNLEVVHNGKVLNNWRYGCKFIEEDKKRSTMIRKNCNVLVPGADLKE